MERGWNADGTWMERGWNADATRINRALGPGALSWALGPPRAPGRDPPGQLAGLWPLSRPAFGWAHPPASLLFDEEMYLGLAKSAKEFQSPAHPMVTRSISSIYRFIVMLVADITDVR